MTLQDDELIQNLQNFGYRIYADKFELVVKRKLRTPLLVWILVFLFGVFLLIYPYNPYMLISGVVLIFTPFIIYRWNVATKIKFDKFNRLIIYHKGLLGLNHQRRFEDVKTMRLRTYDVQSSASPFYKGAREYIAEIRILWNNGGSVEVFYFERRVEDEIKFAGNVLSAVSDFTGIHNTVANNA